MASAQVVQVAVVDIIVQVAVVHIIVSRRISGICTGGTCGCGGLYSVDAYGICTGGTRSSGGVYCQYYQ